jgi:PadR family transcriptional regulator PadR
MKPKAAEFGKKFDKEIKTGIISLLVLLVISKDKKPCYGYKIIKILETLSSEKFKFQEGTIYPVLSSLTSKGLLTSYWGDAPEGPRRKYYKLTPEGKTALELALIEWKAVVTITDDIIKNLGVKE